MSVSEKTRFTFADATKIVLDAARETPRQMFSPWAAFFGAARDIATGRDPRQPAPAAERDEADSRPAPAP